MPTVQREIMIRCSPEHFLGFVMDIERYAEVDDKLGAFDWVRREGNLVEFRFRPVLPGIPGPAPRMTAQGRLTLHQGTESRLTRRGFEEPGELVGVPSGELAGGLDGSLAFAEAHGVDGEVAHDGHVAGAVAGAQP